MKTYKQIFCLSFFLFSLASSVFSQVGINTSSPDSSSALDIVSTDSGVLVPRMTQLQKNNITSPAKGLLIFQNDAQEGFWFFDGTIWSPIDTDTTGEFISESKVIHNTTNIKEDDFVLGSTSLDDIAGTDDDKRFFFDKGKAAFRAGNNNGTSWDNAQLGSNSFAAGSNNTASGSSSVALGRETIASGIYAVSIGRSNTVSSASGTAFGYLNQVTGDYGTALGRANRVSGQYALASGVALTTSGLHAVALGTTNTASGENSFVMGRLNNASGLNSAAFGFTNTASNEGAFAFGNVSTASGVNSMAIGNNLGAPSFSEIAVGLYNTTYTPNSIVDSDDLDRVFSVGNGFRTGGVTTKSNALTILKNGNTGIGTDEPTETLEVVGTIKATSINFSGLIDYTSVADANADSTLASGDIYRIGTDIKIKL